MVNRLNQEIELKLHVPAGQYFCLPPSIAAASISVSASGTGKHWPQGAAAYSA